MNIPLNTYRIQFNEKFTFKDLQNIIPYLVKTGIDCIYASPVFKAVPGSSNGYDITDPHQINPEVGTYSELTQIKEELNRHNIKWIQDIVPNHMAFHPDNFWLMDVLEKKRESEYYNFFDIYWHHPYYKNKLMAPFLGEPLDEAIDSNKINLKLTDEGINICYYDYRFPAAITSYKYILEAANYLKRKVLSIINRDEEIQENLDRFSQNKNLLREFLDLQNFQLVYWQEADQTINYRRFFTINGLISLKMEEEYVFNYYHKFIFRLIKDEIIDGLRIDHIDGLSDPINYLTRLRKAIGKDVPVIVEKILESYEELPANRQVQGTTGYDFLTNVNRLLTDNSQIEKLKNIYHTFIKSGDEYENIAFENKLNFLKSHMGGELHNLHLLLKEILPDANKEALASLLAAMPVYRLYPSQKGLTAYELSIIDKAAEQAKKYAGSAYVDDTIKLMKDADGDQWLYFMQRFQQLSGPLAAKGIEDTTFYQYNVLISHNEVGDNPVEDDYSMDSFSEFILTRNKFFQHPVNTTSTHDTKRGEDARMRINVISEQPELWQRNVFKYKELNRNLKVNSVPDDNDEYFLYQSIIGSLPASDNIDTSYINRLKNYMVKVVREGKINSDWTKPNEAYENNLKNFIDGIFLNKDFLNTLNDFHKISSFYGSLNSLSQLVIKCTVPGIADVYQGSELWNFSFVDPDNRLSVDYNLRNELTDKIINYTYDELLNLFIKDFNSSIVKLFFTTKLLQLRLEYRDLFLSGDYKPLETYGNKSNNLYAIKRSFEEQEAIIVCGRILTSVYPDFILNKKYWQETFVNTNSTGNYLSIFHGNEVQIKSELAIDEIFRHFPISVLIKK
jgi:(1->4)-alpha-D-glucan 1-alpha-D-glucosylmutase